MNSSPQYFRKSLLGYIANSGDDLLGTPALSCGDGFYFILPAPGSITELEFKVLDQEGFVGDREIVSYEEVEEIVLSLWLRKEEDPDMDDMDFKTRCAYIIMEAMDEPYTE